VECGKVCRTTVEEESHTRFTQHATFEDQTCDGVDTEKEMSLLRQEQQQEEDEDTDMMVEPEVNQEWVEQLVAMGFSKNKAIRSLHFSPDATGVEGALEWISSHEDDPKNSDEPLLVPAKKEQPKLTPEEAKAKADELLRKAKAKREAEEREMEKLREAERIRSGKELAAMARKEEEQRLKRMADERKREKEEALRAKEKIKKKLGMYFGLIAQKIKKNSHGNSFYMCNIAEQDRMERRAAMGLPPELTEEEKEEERRRLEQRAKEEAKAKLPIKSREKADAMRNLLVAMKKAHEDSRVGFETLNKLVGNVVAQPDNPKFRTIKLENLAIQKRVGKFPEAIEFLQIAGFRLQDSVMTMDEGDTCLPTLQSALESLDSALNNPFFGAL
jgi:hypothetical protein